MRRLRNWLGLKLMSIGAFLYFDTREENFKQKTSRLVHEINGDLLEAHLTTAGGYGYSDSELNIKNSTWIGASIVLVLKRSKMDIDQKPSPVARSANPQMEKNQ